MSELWYSLGVIRWPLTFSLIAVLALSAFSATRLWGSGVVADLRTRAWVDAILFWGGFALVAGVLGTLVGFVVAAGSIERAGDVSPSLMWGGIKVALLSSAFGATVLALAALSWFGLQLRWRLLVAARSEPSRA